MVHRARAAESKTVGTAYDPQYERLLAPPDASDPRSLATLDRLMRREIEGQNPWRDIAWTPRGSEKPYWQGVPVYSALSTISIACAIGDRLLFCRDPYAAYFTAVGALTRKRIPIKNDALWRRFILTASSIEKKPFREVWKALHQEHAALYKPPFLSVHHGLRLIYHGLLSKGWRGFRGPLLSLMEALPWPEDKKERSQRRMEVDRALRDVLDQFGYQTEKLDLPAPLVGADLVNADFSNKDAPTRVLDDAGQWLELNEWAATKALSTTDLSFTDLRYSWLNGADFRGTDLRFANFHGSDLGDADFSGADLRFAVLPTTTANFSNALRMESDRAVKDWVVKDGKMRRV